jgi:signal transduction histidine kinase
MKFLQIVQPKNWTRLSKKLKEPNDDLRRDILFSQILIVGLIISFFHFVNDLIKANPQAYIIDAVFILVLTIFYVLNEKGAHRVAKILDLSVLNFLIFFLAAVLDERIRMSYNFFPLAILAFLVFHKTELWFSILLSFLSMTLLVILEVTNYHPFGSIPIKEGVDEVTLFINIIGSFVLLVMGLLFLVKLNEQAESELKKKELNLRKINSELDRFVYSASHDLRAPLLSVKGLTNLMKYESPGEVLTEYINKVDQRITDLDKFIGEIIDYSRNSRLELDLKRTSLNLLIDEVAIKLKYMDGASQINLIRDIKVNEIVTDVTRMSVLLSNLLSNAIKYSDPKKDSCWIRVEADQQDDNMIMTVEDNGIGIEGHHINHIFEMFYRASDASEGSGLGLYIVHETLQKLGGEISTNSSPGKGSVFTIKLPLKY